VRLLFVTHRYGPGMAGGAEVAVRELARRLAARGHAVEVLTTCATDYVTWANTLPEGTTTEDGVTVHRLAVAHERDAAVFGPLSERVLLGRSPGPLHLQRAWMDAQGPVVPELADWLDAHAADHDAAVFSTYLYWTSWRGLPVAARRTATVLQPAAHAEQALRLPLFDDLVRQADALAAYSAEEAALLRRRFHVRRPVAEVGLGLDELSAADAAPDVAGFRRRYGLAERPYVVALGRVDVSKGAAELHDWFAEWRRRHDVPLSLVFVGQRVAELAPRDDVVVTGVVDEATKHAALAGAELLVQPSYFESFSLALCEAWQHGRAALVQGRCAVLAGHAHRSGGGIPYSGFPEFEAALELLLGDPALRTRLGERGRTYVRQRCRWDDVLDRYERLVHGSRARRRGGEPHHWARALPPVPSGR
jgi:glycosyltransferase involved in cell wall biosynthesis